MRFLSDAEGPVSKGVEKFTNNNSEEFTDLEIKQIKFLKKNMKLMRLI